MQTHLKKAGLHTLYRRERTVKRHAGNFEMLLHSSHQAVQWLANASYQT
jgi:hypothetical protein